MQSFSKKDLPENCRILKPNSVMTMDFRDDRYVWLETLPLVCGFVFWESITDTDDSGRRLNLKLDDNNYVHDVGFY